MIMLKQLKSAKTLLGKLLSLKQVFGSVAFLLVDPNLFDTDQPENVLKLKMSKWKNQ